MSSKSYDNEQTILLAQRLLSQRELYTGKLDGWGGKGTRAALLQALPDLDAAPLVVPVPTYVPPAQGAAVDERSERNIATLLPEVQAVARQFVRECLRKGYNVKIISGTRTYEEQDKLYRQAFDGIDNNGNGKIDEAAELVTKAPAGYSNHNFGLAFDIGVFSPDGKTYITQDSQYVPLAKFGKELGLEWGGDWSSFKDTPHYQFRPQWAEKMREADMLAELRRRRAAGLSFFA